MVGVPGPLTFVHAYAVIVPVDAAPVRVTVEAGSVMAWLLPEFAVTDVVAALTVTVTCETEAPPLTDNWNTYVPATRAFTAVETSVLFVIHGVPGPEIFVHL